MSALVASVKEAGERLAQIIERVCGSCGNACCHQGTMMGSADLRRLYKGMLLEPELAATVEGGLRRRGRDLREELAALEQVTEILRSTLPAERRRDLILLEEQLAGWRDFCDRLDRPGPLTMERLNYLLRFSAIRANTLRVLREFPGAVEALSARALRPPAFHANGRRMTAPHCLFLLSEGCLAGPWKPAKCANFYCAGEPNVLEEVAREMPFEEFVLANFRSMTPDQVLRYVEIELALGREFVEPKIIVEPNTALREALVAALRGHFAAVEIRSEPAPFMWSTTEAQTRLEALPAQVAYVIETEATDGGALYEIAVALDRLRAAGKPPAFYLLVGHLGEHSFFPHPMWSDRMMSQPLGFLDLIAVELGP